MLVHTQHDALTRAFSTDATDNPFPSRVPTTTSPASNAGMLKACGDPEALAGRETRNHLLVVPYGTGADNATFDLRVIAWRRTGTLWVPVPLVQLACTLCAAVGVAGDSVTASHRFCDTITATIATTGTDCVAKSPGSDLVGCCLVDIQGAEMVEITVDLGTATAANALVAFV